jgi:FkbM family methyltransferase
VLKREFLDRNPVAKLFPLSTFPRRTWAKFLYLYGPNLRISAGSKVAQATNGNAIVRLNRNAPLGSKGDLIQVPEDGIIYKNIVRYGSWEPEESLFLADGIKELPKGQAAKTVLIDIGANSGLITRQTLRFAQSDCDVFLFEPLKKHTEAIAFNLEASKARHQIHIEQVGLSDRNSSAQLFTDLSNKGNSSVFQTAIADANHEVTDISLVDTHEYFTHHLSNYDCLVLKCDTQGLDASILSKIPSPLWQRVQRAVIEVWAISEVDAADVDELITAIDGLFLMGWETHGVFSVSTTELRHFWLSQSDESRNLFLRKR